VPTKPHQPEILVSDFQYWGLWEAELSEMALQRNILSRSGQRSGFIRMRKESVVDSTASLNCFWVANSRHIPD
jgi:hypothetical protein